MTTLLLLNKAQYIRLLCIPLSLGCSTTADPFSPRAPGTNWSPGRGQGRASATGGSFCKLILSLVVLCCSIYYIIILDEYPCIAMYKKKHNALGLKYILKHK